MLWFWWLSGIALFGVLAYHRAALSAFTWGYAALLVAATVSGEAGIISWTLFALVALPLNLRSLRQNYLVKPLLKLYRQVMPEMSSTEREAIEAGTTWWEADLFRGAPDWHKLHQFPAPRLSAEEQAFVDGPVETVCRMTSDWEVTHQRADLPPEVWQYLKDHGFFAMIIKKEYGGLDFSAYAQSCVLQKLMGVSAVLASTVAVPNSLGPGELLQHYGTDEQKNHYLPRLAKGLEIPCFALTSPEAGSDAGSIPDFGVVCKGQWQGQEVLGMRLTWNKRYITLAPIATVLGLAFKLRDPERLLGGEQEIGITCALIPTNTPGVEIGRRHFPLNIPFQNGPTRGKEVFVPLDYIIGGPKMAGQGWRMLVECLSVGRGISLPSNATGGAKTIALATGAYARIRNQFKTPIGKMEGIQEPLARIGGNAWLLDAATTLTTGAIDLGEKPAIVAAIVKYHCTDRGQKAIVDAMDIHGGKGICLGPENYVGRHYQGAPIAVTVEGANILTRSLIIFGQGAIRCHPYLLAEMQAAAINDDEAALEAFDQALCRHIGYAISNFFRATWLGWSGARLVASPVSDATHRYYQHATRLSSALALLSDLCMGLLGGELKRRERISARLGDILSQLYLASAAAKRFADDGRPAEDLPLVLWAMTDTLHKAEVALSELLDNFPNRTIGRLLRLMLLPWGPAIKRTSDRQDRAVAEILLTPGASRSRIGRGQYLTADPGNAVGALEQTLTLVLQAEPIVKRIGKSRGRSLPFMFLDRLADEALANGEINGDEADLLRRTEVGRLRAINVDDFDPAELAAAVAAALTPHSRAA